LTDEPSAGKISSVLMENLIYPNLGTKRKEILVGPGAGLDTCVIDLGQEKVLVASTDPLSLIPQLGTEDSAWMSVNLLANDLSTSGLSPQYMMVDLNLPPQLSDDTLSSYWKALSEECAALGIAIVGGNTGKFEGCDLTIVGSGTTIAVGTRGKVVSSSGANVGDSIILTKGAAISTTGLLSKIFSHTVSEKLGEEVQQKAEGNFRKISATRDALLAASLGTGNDGVTAIHDVAEGGVFSSMMELATASSLGMKIEKSAILVSSETEGICSLFEIDPYWSLGEGALVITCNPVKAPAIVEKLRMQHVPASIVGEMLEKKEGVFVIQENRRFELQRPVADPYWNAYYSAVDKKWR